MPLPDHFFKFGGLSRTFSKLETMDSVGNIFPTSSTTAVGGLSPQLPQELMEHVVALQKKLEEAETCASLEEQAMTQERNTLYEDMVARLQTELGVDMRNT